MNPDRDNPQEFIRAYIRNVREISRKTMLNNIGEVDPDLLDANICWMSSDNMVSLLANGEVIASLEKSTKICSACKAAFYCNQECQCNDRPFHKGT